MFQILQFGLFESSALSCLHPDFVLELFYYVEFQYIMLFMSLFCVTLPKYLWHWLLLFTRLRLEGNDCLFFVKTPLCSFIIFMGKKINRIGKIPAFIKKLKQILDDKNSVDVICWLPEGNGFQILNTTSFTDKVLPEHFKHKNIASFVRQLNMYGFSRPKEFGQNVYIHPRFQRGNLNGMKLIKRKVGPGKSSEDSNSVSEIRSNRAYQPSKDDGLMVQYQKLLNENQTLRRQNQDLTLKLNVFEQMVGKIKFYTQQIDKLMVNSKEELDNERNENQAMISNCSSQSSSNSNSILSRKGFSLCSSNCSPHFESSYQILLQGKPQSRQNEN